ncbi:hypothetical protein QJS10_CPA06g01898 [Acorus calamus]|uniref:Uncharacterized protein n=1 Tax=Acorus calamus TaxID=4465 RepID=A0AAV9EQH5_ACOCL|nr:hypothetical protein QJS10_CPA06g01898 [Acorus calamus]
MSLSLKTYTFILVQGDEERLGRPKHRIRLVSSNRSIGSDFYASIKVCASLNPSIDVIVDQYNRGLGLPDVI